MKKLNINFHFVKQDSEFMMMYTRRGATKGSPPPSVWLKKGHFHVKTGTCSKNEMILTVRIQI